MQYGMGGTPVDEEKNKEVMDGNYDSGETLPVREVKLFCCDNCRSKVAEEIQIPLFVCQLSAGTRQKVGEEMVRTRDYMPMNGFLLRDL